MPIITGGEAMLRGFRGMGDNWSDLADYSKSLAKVAVGDTVNAVGGYLNRTVLGAKQSPTGGYLSNQGGGSSIGGVDLKTIAMIGIPAAVLAFIVLRK